jgi:uncharacterized protein YkwD
MLALVNAARADEGLAPLVMDGALVAVARAHSLDMAERNFFSHVNPDGENPGDRLHAAGIFPSRWAENIAGAGSTSQAHNLLMNSSGHRANILNPNLGRIGIGVLVGGPYGMYFTQLFTD